MIRKGTLELKGKIRATFIIPTCEFHAWRKRLFSPEKKYWDKIKLPLPSEKTQRIPAKREKENQTLSLRRRLDIVTK